MRNREDLDRDGAADWRTWSVDGARVADIGAAQVELDRTEARQTEMLGQLQRDVLAEDRTQAGPVEWRLAALCADVACELRLSERVVQRLMNLGDELISRLPSTLSLWRDGMLTRRHVEVIAAELTGLDGVERAECEARLLDAAADDSMTPAELRRLARRLRERLREDSPYERHLQARLERHVSLQPADDGMAWLSALLPAVEAAACYDRIRTISVGVKAGGTVGAQGSVAGDRTCGATCGGESRTLTQLHADVLRDLLVHGIVPGADAPREPGQRLVPAWACVDPDLPADATEAAPDVHVSPDVQAGSASNLNVAVSDHTSAGHGKRVGLGSGITARVTVTVPVLALAEIQANRAAGEGSHDGRPIGQAQSPAHDMAELEGVGPISVETARELVGESSTLYRMMTDPITGAVLTLDRLRYRPSADLREFVRARDATCRFPGCRRAAHHCEIDHTVNWEWDGPTSAQNLACLCRRHHVMKHQSDWKVKQVGGAVLRWVSPTGAIRITRPRGATPPRGAAPPSTAPVSTEPPSTEPVNSRSETGEAETTPEPGVGLQPPF